MKHRIFRILVVFVVLITAWKAGTFASEFLIAYQRGHDGMAATITIMASEGSCVEDYDYGPTALDFAERWGSYVNYLESGWVILGDHEIIEHLGWHELNIGPINYCKPAG